MIFEGESTFPQTPQPTFSTDIYTKKKNNNTKTEGRTEELRMKNIVKYEEEKENPDEKSTEAHDIPTDSFHLYKESIEVSMNAELMIQQDLLLIDDVEQEEDGLKITNVTNASHGNHKVVEVLGTTWIMKHELSTTRTLQCTFTHSKRKF